MVQFDYRHYIQSFYVLSINSTTSFARCSHVTVEEAPLTPGCLVYRSSFPGLSQGFYSDIKSSFVLDSTIIVLYVCLISLPGHKDVCRVQPMVPGDSARDVGL